MTPLEIQAKLSSLQAMRLPMRRACADLMECADTTPDELLEAARKLSSLARQMKDLENELADRGVTLRANRYASRARR